jgi:hypothetical protein
MRSKMLKITFIMLLSGSAFLPACTGALLQATYVAGLNALLTSFVTQAFPLNVNVLNP